MDKYKAMHMGEGPEVSKLNSIFSAYYTLCVKYYIPELTLENLRVNEVPDTKKALKFTYPLTP